mmetsp:Transcript_71110/g.212025  ORF Transcript_71110/g.212025 Transcript_71110/m.212025 type:complete len:83 (+) Transcript_71110:1080-1328(+)
MGEAIGIDGGPQGGIIIAGFGDAICICHIIAAMLLCCCAGFVIGTCCMASVFEGPKAGTERSSAGGGTKSQGPVSPLCTRRR